MKKIVIIAAVIAGITAGILYYININDIEENDDITEQVENIDEVENDEANKEEVDNAENTAVLESTPVEFFDLSENKVYVYTSENNPNNDYIMFPLYKEDNIVEVYFDYYNLNIRRSNIYRFDENEIHLTGSVVNPYINGIDKDVINPEDNIVLQGPIGIGMTWSVDDVVYTITDLDADIDTQYTADNIIEVEIAMENNIVNQYYATGIGNIATIEYDNQGEIINAIYLTDIVDSEVPAVIDAYYLNNDSLQDEKVTVETTLATNQDYAEFFENILKNAPEGYSSILIEGISVNSVNYDYASGGVIIDFSESFKSYIEDNGTSIKLELYEAIANTVCSFYDAEYALITVNGEDYHPSDLESNKVYPTY